MPELLPARFIFFAVDLSTILSPLNYALSLFISPYQSRNANLYHQVPSMYSQFPITV